MKICLVGGNFFHEDGQTDMSQLIITCNFVNMPKIVVPGKMPSGK